MKLPRVIAASLATSVAAFGGAACDADDDVPEVHESVDAGSAPVVVKDSGVVPADGGIDAPVDAPADVPVILDSSAQDSASDAKAD